MLLKGFILREDWGLYIKKNCCGNRVYSSSGVLDSSDEDGKEGYGGVGGSNDDFDISLQFCWCIFF